VISKIHEYTASVVEDKRHYTKVIHTNIFHFSLPNYTCLSAYTRNRFPPNSMTLHFAAVLSLTFALLTVLLDARLAVISQAARHTSHVDLQLSARASRSSLLGARCTPLWRSAGLSRYSPWTVNICCIPLLYVYFSDVVGSIYNRKNRTEIKKLKWFPSKIRHPVY